MKNLWAGLGFQRGVTHHDLLQALSTTLQAHGFAREDLRGIATLDLKRQDLNLGHAAQAWGLELCFFSRAQLTSIAVPHPSQRVQAKVQSTSVAEAAALLASSGGNLIVPKQIYRTAQKLAITLALSYVPSAER